MTKRKIKHRERSNYMFLRRRKKKKGELVPLPPTTPTDKTPINLTKYGQCNFEQLASTVRLTATA